MLNFMQMLHSIHYEIRVFNTENIFITMFNLHVYINQSHFCLALQNKKIIFDDTWDCTCIKNASVLKISVSVNGNWATWGSWGACSVSCGSGQQSRTRGCSNPAPAYGGTTCSGTGTETMSCTMPACPGMVPI